MSSNSENLHHGFIYPSGNKKIIIKRRKLSPKIFPKKIHITEEVMADFSRLNITNNKHNRLQRSLSEIEASLDLEDSEEEDNVEMQPAFVVERSFQEEIRRFKYNLLRGGAGNRKLVPPPPPPPPPPTSPLMPTNLNTAVVLYQPREDLLTKLIQPLTTDEVDEDHCEEELIIQHCDAPDERDDIYEEPMEL